MKYKKVCCNCDRELPIESFAILADKADGRANECKQCKTAYNNAIRRVPDSYGVSAQLQAWVTRPEVR